MKLVISLGATILIRAYILLLRIPGALDKCFQPPPKKLETAIVRRRAHPARLGSAAPNVPQNHERCSFDLQRQGLTEHTAPRQVWRNSCTGATNAIHALVRSKIGGCAEAERPKDD
jgi:hypothetical protein